MVAKCCKAMHWACTQHELQGAECNKENLSKLSQAVCVCYSKQLFHGALFSRAVLQKEWMEGSLRRSD